MTDKKEIIIDGVDVSGCEYYAQGICNIPDVIETYDSCMDKGACYFKQLKRKEHELKTIREAFEIELENIISEIKNICQEDTHTFADGTELRCDSLNEILAIIDMAEGRSK